MSTDLMPHWPLMKYRRLARWLELRSSPYIVNRLFSLLNRYGLTSTKAKRRVLECIRLMAKYDCAPTFPTPGRVLQRDPEFFRTIQEMGAELNIHGYDHIDFLSLSRDEANKQFVKAIDVFDRAGIRAEGFRCPYLSFSDVLLEALPPGRIKYSSNRAISWNVRPAANGQTTAVFDTLRDFYRPDLGEHAVSTPRFIEAIVEVPVSIPDDLQMFDGLKMNKEAIAQAWLEILRETHNRGELFAVMFHPELIDECKDAFEAVLRTARALQPAVWVTQLRDVSTWWREKSAFGLDVTEASSGLRLRFDCSENASVLIRNLSAMEVAPWDGTYSLLQGRELCIDSHRRPFIGLSHRASAEVALFLREQGFIVETGAEASRCTIRLDDALLANWPNHRHLLDYIETSTAPLIRFGRWPNRAKSVLCMTGDLDALNLFDYTSRIFVK